MDSMVSQLRFDLGAHVLNLFNCMTQSAWEDVRDKTLDVIGNLHVVPRTNLFLKNVENLLALEALDRI